MERSTRTAFAYNLSLKADERDIYQYFSKVWTGCQGSGRGTPGPYRPCLWAGGNNEGRVARVHEKGRAWRGVSQVWGLGGRVCTHLWRTQA